MSWLEARPKIEQGREHTDTVEVPIGGGTITLTHRLLTERELTDVEAALDRQDMVDHIESDVSDYEQRFQELQSKDELTAAEKQELEDLGRQIQAEQAGIMDSMGKEAFDAFMDAGKKALVPTDDDIDDYFGMEASEQRDIFGFLPETRTEMREAIKDDMVEVVEGQPYPFKFIVGQKAYAESLSLLGDTDLDAGNPTPTA